MDDVWAPSQLIIRNKVNGRLTVQMHVPNRDTHIDADLEGQAALVETHVK